MSGGEKLKALFRAFGEGDNTAFVNAAEAIIAEELAANHHALATDLKKALHRRSMNGASPPQHRSLTTLPKERRNGENLIVIHESDVAESRIVLSAETDQRIARILQEHRSRTVLARHGYRPKTQILFWGPPGCGKTYTAYHIAHELGLPIGVLRLNAVISSFLGDTASHLHRVFDLARATPMVLLLDEVDAVAKDRDDRNDVGELKRVVNSLLQAMDSFRPTSSLVIAASNHQYMLDPAAWRRFDDIVSFPMPGPAERERHLRMLLTGVGFEGSIPNLARGLTALSFADIERVTVEAIKTAILDNRSVVHSSDIARESRVRRKTIASAQTPNDPGQRDE